MFLPLVPRTMMEEMALILATSVFTGLLMITGPKLERTLTARPQMIGLGSLCPFHQTAMFLPLVPRTMMEEMALILATSVFTGLLMITGPKLERTLTARPQVMSLGTLCPFQ